VSAAHASNDPDQLRRDRDRDAWLAAGGNPDPPCALPTCEVLLSSHNPQAAGLAYWHEFEWPVPEEPLNPEYLALLPGDGNQPPTAGHQIVREQLARHGTDRYPTPELQLLKLVSEVGELADAWLKAADGGTQAQLDHIRAEFADAALSLYALGDKLGLDVITEMRALVAADSRKFTEVMDHQDEQLRLAGQLHRHLEDAAVLKPPPPSPLGAVTYSDIGCVGPMPCQDPYPHEPHSWEAGRGPLGPLMYRCSGGARL
jgi:NTP pyrophosphatase (non-canonical NTP hydrolase)